MLDFHTEPSFVYQVRLFILPSHPFPFYQPYKLVILSTLFNTNCLLIRNVCLTHSTETKPASHFFNSYT